jgi:hypothetical protein
MIPRIIHLNWLDEEPTPKVLDTVEYWQANGEGREVRLHSDSSALRPTWRENYESYATNHWNKSDWMRWSHVLDVGGWYFDVDIRMTPATSLDDAEAHMQSDTCLLVPMVAGMRTLEADILCCQPSWQGAAEVDAYFLKKHEKKYSFFHYTLKLVDALYRRHRNWITIGSANLLRNDWRDKDRLFGASAVDCCDTCTDRPPDCWKAVNYGCIHSEAYERREKLRRSGKCPRVSNKSIVQQR